jgi:hypothetical protein
MKAAAIAFASCLCAFFGAPLVCAEEGAVSTLSPPPLALTVTPGKGGGPWKLGIENTGDVPIRIAADPRLLILEVTPPVGTVLDTTPKRPAPKAADPVTVRCALPEDARPATDEGHDLVVPGKRSWSATIDPLFYCFGPRERRALVTGASVKARFGWPAPSTKAAARKKPSPPGPPFAGAPVGTAIGKVAPSKELEGTPFTLGETVGASTTPAPEPSPPGRAVVNVSMPETRDVARGVEIETTVTVVNDGDQAATLLFHPDTIRFSVSGPQGSYACGTAPIIASPIRELYSTIGAKGRASLSLLLTAKCPDDTFDEPGVYRVTAILDTSTASARPIGLKTWDGSATARTPMLLRVRAPRQPSAATSHPTLD